MSREGSGRGAEPSRTPAGPTGRFAVHSSEDDEKKLDWALSPLCGDDAGQGGAGEWGGEPSSVCRIPDGQPALAGSHPTPAGDSLHGKSHSGADHGDGLPSTYVASVARSRSLALGANSLPPSTGARRSLLAA